MATKEEYEDLHNWLGARIGDYGGYDVILLPIDKAKMLYEFMELWLAE